MSGPSDKAVEAARSVNRAPSMGEDTLQKVGEAMHDPALGLDRSVCVRDVVEALRKARRNRADDDGAIHPMPVFGWLDAADHLEREFGLTEGAAKSSSSVPGAPEGKQARPR